MEYFKPIYSLSIYLYIYFFKINFYNFFPPITLNNLKQLYPLCIYFFFLPTYVILIFA